MDFPKRLADLEREHQGGNPFTRADAFLNVHLDYAQALQSTDPEAALRQYLLAEDCQSTITSGATSGGEGCAGMTELYRIQGMRADTLERMADAAGDPEAALKRLSEALAVWMKIQKDPNDLAELTPAESRCKRLGEKILRLQNRSGRS
jgi:hypothetical protein